MTPDDQGRPAMTREEVRQAVLAAIAAGRIPPGGPSELAARDLIDDTPAGYLRRWGERAAARIRADIDNAKPEEGAAP